jgi:hypothetical protein
LRRMRMAIRTQPYTKTFFRRNTLHY